MTDELWEKIDKFKLPIGLSVIGLVLIIGGIFSSGLHKQTAKEYPKASLIDSQKLISVDVSGAVINPGVYQIKDGSRIEEVIKAAGGFTEQANKEYISKYLNMAQKVSDGSKLYVPFEGEQTGGPQVGGVARVTSQSQVNINTASQAEIEALPGIGLITASKIIAGRPYQTVEELQSKKIVSKAVFEKIKDMVVVY